MANRRPLTEGIKTPTPAVDAQLEREFVYQNKEAAQAVLPKSSSSAVQQLNRVPISTRIRAELATAIKRASLERQLEGVSPNTLQDILEQAIETWLKSNGYLP